MTTLVRDGTLTFSRRYRYEPLGLKSNSYRLRRAKQRQIFLTTYRLSSFAQDFPDSKPPSSSSSPKLKKVAVKVKKMVNSVLMFVRTGSFKSCNSKSSISAASPASPSSSSNSKTCWP